MKKFDTYIHKQQIITPEQKVYQMFVQINNGEWKFNGLVSENAKNMIRSDVNVKNLNDKYNDQEILSSFTKLPIEETKKSYIFIPCPNAEISIFCPSYKDI